MRVSTRRRRNAGRARVWLRRALIVLANLHLLARVAAGGGVLPFFAKWLPNGLAQAMTVAAVAGVWLLSARLWRDPHAAPTGESARGE